jgi:hypothetical protein
MSARFTARRRFKLWGSHPVATLSLITLFLITATQWLRDTSDRVDELLHGNEYAHAPFNLDSFTFEVVGVDPSAEAAGYITEMSSSP